MPMHTSGTAAREIDTLQVSQASFTSLGSPCLCMNFLRGSGKGRTQHRGSPVVDPSPEENAHPSLMWVCHQKGCRRVPRHQDPDVVEEEPLWLPPRHSRFPGGGGADHLARDYY